MPRSVFEDWIIVVSGGVGGDMDLLLFYFDICYLLFVYIDMRLLEGLNVSNMRGLVLFMILEPGSDISDPLFDCTTGGDKLILEPLKLFYAAGFINISNGLIGLLSIDVLCGRTGCENVGDCDLPVTMMGCVTLLMIFCCGWFCTSLLVPICVYSYLLESLTTGIWVLSIL